MTGFLLPPASGGTRRSRSRSRKRQTRRNPSSFVASVQPSLPSPVCLEPVPPRSRFLLWRSRAPARMARPSPRVCSGALLCFPPPGSLPPPGPLLGVRGLPLPSVFHSCGAHLKVLKVALLKKKIVIIMHIQVNMRKLKVYLIWLRVCMHVRAQSCSTLCNSMDCSPPAPLSPGFDHTVQQISESDFMMSSGHWSSAV